MPSSDKKSFVSAAFSEQFSCKNFNVKYHKNLLFGVEILPFMDKINSHNLSSDLLGFKLD